MGKYKNVDRRVGELIKRIVNGEVVVIRGKRVLCAKKIPSEKRRYRVLVLYEDLTQEVFLPSVFVKSVWKSFATVAQSTTGTGGQVAETPPAPSSVSS